MIKDNLSAGGKLVQATKDNDPDREIMRMAAAKQARVDLPRHEPRITVRVVSRPTAHATCGYLLEHGENLITIYESDLPALQAQVDTTTDEDIALAKRFFERDREEWEVSGKRYPEDKYPGSMEGFLREVTNRDPQPLVSVEVIDPAPKAAPKAARG